MKLKLVGSSTEGAGDKQFLTSLVIEDSVAIDAGCLGFAGEPKEQARIRHVLLSHTHMDHLASLPLFLENVYSGTPSCITLHASASVCECLREHIFNGRIWPDFLTLGGPDAPFCRLEVLEDETTVEVGGLEVTPVELTHGIPTFGFIIATSDAAIAVASDTAPTKRIWEIANRVDRLKAVCLDCSFPNSMDSLARLSYHLTPSLFATEIEKIREDARIFAVHIKPRFRRDVVRELEGLGISRLEISTPGREFEI